MHRLKNVLDPKPMPSVSVPQQPGELDWKPQTPAAQTLHYGVLLRLGWRYVQAHCSGPIHQELAIT